MNDSGLNIYFLHICYASAFTYKQRNIEQRLMAYTQILLTKKYDSWALLSTETAEDSCACTETQFNVLSQHQWFCVLFSENLINVS